MKQCRKTQVKSHVQSHLKKNKNKKTKNNNNNENTHTHTHTHKITRTKIIHLLIASTHIKIKKDALLNSLNIY